MTNRKAAIFFGILTSVLIILFGGYFLAGYCRYSPIPFESKAWKADQWGNEEVRWRMHADLLAHHGLLGMSRKQVVELLGPAGDGNQVSYMMGSGGYSLAALNLYYKNDRVARCDVYINK